MVYGKLAGYIASLYDVPFCIIVLFTGEHCRRADNVKRLKKNFKRLIWASLRARTDLPYFVTLTFRDDVSTLGEAYVLFREAMRRFQLRYNVEYIGVPEFQKKGRVHFHILMWGNLKRPYYDFLCAKAEYKSMRALIGKDAVRRNDEFSDTWGHGFLDVVQCDNRSNRIGSYMAKYMTKDTLDQRTYGKKSYTRSRMALQVISMWSYGLINNPTGEIVCSFTYDTKYLGEGSYILLDLST